MGAVTLQRARRPATRPHAKGMRTNAARASTGPTLTRAPRSPRGAYQRVSDRARACQRVPAGCARHASGVPDDQVMTSPDLIIQAEVLRKRFGSPPAFDGVALAVPAGTVLGVLGPNFDGKATT